VFLQRGTKAATRDADNAARLALSIQLFSDRWFSGSTGYPDSRLGQGHEESEEEKMAKSKSKTKAKRGKWSLAELSAGYISHEELLSAVRSDVPGQDLPFLGHARAVVIVTFCAKTSPANLSRTLAELGVDGNSFQTCVFEGIRQAGYEMDVDKIPNRPDTKLIKGVSVIQSAPKTDG
jgi:hypothetical protein